MFGGKTHHDVGETLYVVPSLPPYEGLMRNWLWQIWIDEELVMANLFSGIDDEFGIRGWGRQ